MDYLQYNTEDFAADESYLSYYFKTNEADIKFWENWISQHPEKLDLIMNADHLIGMLGLTLPEDELYKEYDRLQEKLYSDIELKEPFEKNKSNYKKKGIRKLATGWKLIGVVCLLLIMCAWVFVFKYSNNNKIEAGNALLIHKINNSEVAERLLLEDGTLVTLQPKSEISYPKHFPADKREIFLNGEAFFEVSKNASRPFYVYHENLVTHVLGTSFRIKAFKYSNDMEVSVRTGKVEVYDGSLVNANSKSGTAKDAKKVVLTFNERLVYKKDVDSFETSIVNLPAPKIEEHKILQGDVKSILDYMPPDNFVFDYETLGNIIKIFETNYGINIIVNNPDLNNCHFSGDVSNMAFFKKLDVICQALNVTYEIIGTEIVILGKGCK